MRQEVEAWIRNAWLHGKIRGVVRQMTSCVIRWCGPALDCNKKGAPSHIPPQFVTLEHRSYHIMTWLRKDHYNTRINLAALLAPDTAWFLHLQEDWINSSSQQHHCHNKLVLLRGVTGRITSYTTEAYKMVHHNGITRQYFSPAVTHHKCSHAPCVLENTVESLPSASPAIAPLELGCVRHSLEKQLCILPSASSLPRNAICYLSSSPDFNADGRKPGFQVF